MIVATAGHVDHGKTLLIKTLTGVDTDRLPDEKKRGLTIDLGFAYLPLDGHDEPIGFIDVPGHEKFIRNMVCGVAGIDYALFVIAADDGPMPQSREHLAILNLLGVKAGIIALTKTDRVSADRLAEVKDDIEELLLGTTLENAEIKPVSALQGDGVTELRDHLTAQARAFHARPSSGHFRLAVDRRFDITGAGLIVTGTVFSGTCRVGDQVRILGAPETFRVRSIRAQNEDRQSAQAGQRTALNLTGQGLNRDLVHRGDWIVTSPTAEPTFKFDARLHVLPGEPSPVPHWMPVHVHHGAAETTGRVAVLEDKSIAPGTSGLVQLVLDHPLGAHQGDGFIIRDQSSTRTIGGGHVIDIFPPIRRRAATTRLNLIRALESPDHASALRAATEASAEGLDAAAFQSSRNLTRDEFEALKSAASIKFVGNEANQRAFDEPQWQKLHGSIVKTLQSWHSQHPDQVGLADVPLLKQAGYRLPDIVAQAVAAEVEKDGTIIRERLGLRLPTHQAGFQGDDAILWQKIAGIIEADGLRPGSLADVADKLDMPQRRLQSFLTGAGRHGLAHRISNTRYLTESQITELRALAEKTATEDADGALDVRAFRDATEIGRNMAIEVLEYFDKLGYTARRGETREIKKPAN
ncbi:MAG: selenocysteine-specific elongation factor [Hyphomicrobiaceae bacterium]|jgi:selenocysteine-specific elongation factor